MLLTVLHWIRPASCIIIRVATSNTVLPVNNSSPKQYYRFEGRPTRMASPIASVLLVALFFIGIVEGSLQVGYYSKSCKNAEAIIFGVVQAAYRANQGTAPGVLRLHFHDCFVNGCDASILLDGTAGKQTEKNSIPNLSLRGFEVIDAAKAALEKYCPQVVSCADILAFAARDSVLLASGGLKWAVPAGRKDGTVSRVSDPPLFLPAPNSNVDVLLKVFAPVKLDKTDMVALSGAHTIGRAHCGAFSPLRTTNIDPSFAARIVKTCPRTSPPSNNVVSMDSFTPNRFDRMYFQGIQAKKGLFPSDQVLLTDARTKSLVNFFAGNEAAFRAQFAKSMIKMGSAKLLTGKSGIRTNCRKVNV